VEVIISGVMIVRVRGIIIQVVFQTFHRHSEEDNDAALTYLFVGILFEFKTRKILNTFFYLKYSYIFRRIASLTSKSALEEVTRETQTRQYGDQMTNRRTDGPTD
jgi:hypothetical protein